MIFWQACQKENKIESHSIINGSVDYRNPLPYDPVWVSAFQRDLRKALGDTLFSKAYTPQEVAFGIETLINLAATTDTATVIHKTQVDRFSFSVTSTPQLVKQLYTSVYGDYLNHHILSSQYDKAVAVALSLKVDSIVGSTAFFTSVSTIGASNSCIRSRHGGEKSPVNISCDGSPQNPFKAPDGFRMGWGDKEKILHTVYDPTDCETACGNFAVCELGTTTAWEEIQSALNARYPKPKSPDPAKPYFWGFSNIGFYNLFLGGPMEPHIKSGCNLYSNRGIGYCMQYEELNCVYCAIFDGIFMKVAPYDQMPAGAYFVSINIAADKCLCVSTPECLKHSAPFARVFYGTPIFKNYPKGPTGPHLPTGVDSW